MTTAVEIIIVIGVFYFGVFIGFILRKWLVDRSGYDGDLLIIKDDDKIIYSLELHDDPEMMEFKNELIFKVKPLEESSDRR
jgi:hypothetical protein